MWHICNEGPGFDLMKDEQLLATGSEPSCMVRNGYDWLGHVRIKHWLFRAQLPSPWHLCFLELLASGCASLARVQPPEGDYYDELPSGFVNILALQVDCLWHSASDDFFWEVWCEVRVVLGECNYHCLQCGMQWIMPWHPGAWPEVLLDAAHISPA